MHKVCLIYFSDNVIRIFQLVISSKTLHLFFPDIVLLPALPFGSLLTCRRILRMSHEEILHVTLFFRGVTLGFSTLETKVFFSLSLAVWLNPEE